MSTGQQFHHLGLVTATLLLGAALSPASAQLTPSPGPDEGLPATALKARRTATNPKADEAWLEKTIADLGSDDFATRDKASSDLAGDDRLTLPLIEKRLADPARPLTAEQALRLNEAGLKLFASSQRGAMGVSFALTDGAVDGVKVGGAVDGFDSKRVLKAGDVIREMDSVSLAVGDQMRSRNLAVALIISHDPGEEVSLNLLRNGEPVVVRLRLGNYSDLRNANELDVARLHLAWDMRCHRIAAPDPEPECADAGLSPDRWNQISDPVKRAAVRQLAILRQNNQLATVGSQEAQPQPDSGVLLAAAGAGHQLLTKPDEDFSANERSTRFIAQVQQIQNQIERNNSLIQLYQKRVNDPNLPANQRSMFQATIRSYQQQNGMLREQKKRLVGLQP